MSIASVPIGTWDQIGVVVIFVVLLVTMGGTFLRALKDMMKSFQEFISTRDQQWQAYFEKREDEFSQRNTSVVQAVNSLTGAFTHLSEQFQEHDKLTSNAIATMKERTRPVPPRWVNRPPEHGDEGKAAAD